MSCAAARRFRRTAPPTPTLCSARWFFCSVLDTTQYWPASVSAQPTYRQGCTALGSGGMRTYRHGDAWRASDCQSCTCQHGQLHCFSQTCPAAAAAVAAHSSSTGGSCSSAVLRKGQCCPICTGKFCAFSVADADAATLSYYSALWFLPFVFVSDCSFCDFRPCGKWHRTYSPCRLKAVLHCSLQSSLRKEVKKPSIVGIEPGTYDIVTNRNVIEAPSIPRA